VLLKGPVLARWLYDADEVRSYCDVDLLVDPAQHTRAERVLTDVGFERYVRPWEQEARRSHHDATWTRAIDGGIVDLHRTLPGVRGVSPEQMWRRMRSHTVAWEMPAPGGIVRVLDEAGCALLVGLHAAHHLGDAETWSQPVVDLEHAVARVPVATWVAAAALAFELRAAAHLARGLHMVAGGDVLAAQVGLPRPGSGEDTSAGLERMADAQGTRERLGVLAHAVAPSPDYMRWWSSVARRGRGWLVIAYLLRPFQLLGGAPRGILTWRRARRLSRQTR
jgi:hypothetical protein